MPSLRTQRTLLASALAAGLLFAGTAGAQSAAGLEHGAGQVSRAAPGRALTPASRAASAAVVAGYLRSRGRSEAVLASLRTTATPTGAHGVSHVRIEQVVDGLTVHGAYLKAAVNARGELVHVVDNLAPVSTPRAARVDALAALKATLAQLHPAQVAGVRAADVRGNTAVFDGGAFFHQPPEVTAVAVAMSDGALARGWLVETWTRQTNLLHHTLVGGDGQILDVELRTASDSYHVFPIDPSKGGQAVVPGPGAGNAQSPAGWLGGGAQTTLAISGNNVAAYLDRNNDNLSDGGGSAATVDFLASANLAAAPTAGANQAVAVQNLFYLNNRVHDILYRHGFNEAAGNFQRDNFGKGGRGGDPVQAEAQDGGGTDNANFATPRDGSRPRMQMYLWTGAGPTHQVLVNSTVYNLAGSSFGPEFSTGGVSGALAAAVPANGCTAISTDLTGKVALVDRGTCDFSLKVLNAQLKGAVAVVIANNDAANADAVFPPGPGADATSVTIPSGMVGFNSGTALKTLAGSLATLSKLAVQPLQIDASLDSDIVYHEFGHGLTWRMIGRMSGPLSGAIGEGMSDGVALLINDENDVVAEYSASDPRGIRSAPYTNYGRSYADVAGTGVHFDGEVYAAIVWKLIQDFGTANRDKLFAYIVDGMNYTRAHPTYEDMRDGILASVAAGSSPADCTPVWAAFAHYGVGVGASGAVRGAKVVITESKTAPAACN